jgi:hypothetical protein
VFVVDCVFRKRKVIAERKITRDYILFDDQGKTFTTRKKEYTDGHSEAAEQ